MSDHWDVYLTKIEYNNIFVRLDMGIKNNVPVRNANKLVIVKVQTKSLFSTKLNFKILSEIEDTFDRRLTKKDFFIGVTTDSECRSFYFYTMQETILKNSIESILSRNKKLKYNILIQEDPDWNIYLDRLYPNIFEQRWMLDRNVVERLKTNNDDLQIPREVSHWIYFRNINSRESFKSKMNKSLYTSIEEQKVQENSDFSYQLIVSHITTVQLESINQHTTCLFQLAQEFEGNYDGWETQVMKRK